MATRRYSTQPGDKPGDITEAVGAATATKCIELTFDLANVKQGSTTPLTRQDVIDALERFKLYILADTFPPA